VEGEEGGFGGGKVVDREIVEIAIVQIMEIEYVGFDVEGMLRDIGRGLVIDVVEAEATGDAIEVLFEVARSGDGGDKGAICFFVADELAGVDALGEEALVQSVARDACAAADVRLVDVEDFHDAGLVASMKRESGL
jgi:hypothetical protein